MSWPNPLLWRLPHRPWSAVLAVVRRPGYYDASPADVVRPLVLMPHEVSASRFLSDLDRVQNVGFDVGLGRENLTDGLCQPNVVPFIGLKSTSYWGGNPRTPEARSAPFLRRLDEYKDAGALIVPQVHNLHPHEGDLRHWRWLLTKVCWIVVDLLVHHCPALMELLRRRYSVRPAQRSVVTPFRNHLSYPNSSNRDEARRRLGLPLDGFVFLHFGENVAYKELDILLKAFCDEIRAKCLLVAGRYLRQPARQLA